MVMLVITYFMKKRKIGGEILLWSIIQRKTNYFYIVHFMWINWKSIKKHCGCEESALNLSQDIICGLIYSTKHIGINETRQKIEGWLNKNIQKKFDTK